MSVKYEVFRYIKIVLGCLLASIPMPFFLLPNNVVLGGVGGVSQIIYHFTGFPPGIMFFLFNIPIFLVATKSLGKPFIFRALLSVVLSSFVIDFFRMFNFVATTDPFLVALYSGILIGVGVGLLLSADSSAGGIDVLAKMIHKKRPDLSLGQVIMMFDFSVITLGVFVFRSLDLAMYAFFTIFIMIQIIDFILSFGRHAEVCYIITKQKDLLQNSIVDTLKHGVTILPAVGGYSGDEKTVLICAIRNKKQIITLKKLVHELDPDAFFYIHGTKNIFGHGFTSFHA